MLGRLYAQKLGDAVGQTIIVDNRAGAGGNIAGELLARVDAGIRSAGHFATLAGALLGGLLGNAMGTRFVLWLAVLFIAAAALLAGETTVDQMIEGLLSRPLKAERE